MPVMIYRRYSLLNFLKKLNIFWIRSSITKAFGKQPVEYSEVESDISFVGSNRPSSDGFEPGRMSKLSSISSDGSLESELIGSKGSEGSYMNDQFSSISFESVSYNKLLRNFCFYFYFFCCCC